MALQERQRLSALEVERRAALRGHEAEMAAEQARLDDRAKEQRLAQVAIVEQSYQKQLQVMSALKDLQCDPSGVQLAEFLEVRHLRKECAQADHEADHVRSVGQRPGSTGRWT